MRVIKSFHLDQPPWKASRAPDFPVLQFCLSGCHLKGACSRLSDLIPRCSQWTHTYHTHTKPASEAVFQLLTELLSDSQFPRAQSVRGGRKHGAPRGPPFACTALPRGQPIAYLLFALWESPSRGRTAVRDPFSLKVTARKEVLIWDRRDFSWQLEMFPLKGKENWTGSSFSYWTPHLVSVLASPPWHRLLAELLSTWLVNRDL